MSMSNTSTSSATATLKIRPEQQKDKKDKKYLTENLPSPGIHNIAMGEYEYIHKIPTFSNKYAERQWMLEHMAGAFRVFGRKGYGMGAAGHISIRDPVDPDTFWINPLGKHFSSMKVTDLVHVDKNAKVIGGNKAAINSAGFKIHCELHKARPDVNAACHTHSLHGKAYSTFGKELEMINQDVCAFYKAHTVYNDFGGVVLEAEEGKRLAEALCATNKAIILQNHGILTIGSNIDEAAFLFTLME